MELIRNQTVKIDKYGKYTIIKQPDGEFDIVKTSWFNSNYKKHEPDWFYDRKNIWKNSFIYISKKSFGKYLLGIHTKYEYNDWEFLDLDKLIKLLEDKNYDLLFKNNLYYDGYLYRPDSKVPVFCWVWLEMWESRFNLQDAIKIMKKYPKQFRGMKIVNTPGYNVDISGRHELEFQYKPTEQDWKDVSKNKYPSCELENKIKFGYHEIFKDLKRKDTY